jgi:hypothetical protein
MSATRLARLALYRGSSGVSAAESLPIVAVVDAATALLLLVQGRSAAVAILVAIAWLAAASTAAWGSVETAAGRTIEAAGRTAGTIAATAAAGRTAGTIATATAAGWAAVAATATAGWTAVAAAACAAITATAAAGTARLALASFIDPKLTTVEFVTVELLQRLRSTLGRRHLDEGEAARATRLSIHDDRHAHNFPAVGAECFSERCFVRVVVQIANVELRSHGLGLLTIRQTATG